MTELGRAASRRSSGRKACQRQKITDCQSHRRTRTEWVSDLVVMCAHGQIGLRKVLSAVSAKVGFERCPVLLIARRRRRRPVSSDRPLLRAAGR